MTVTGSTFSRAWFRERFEVVGCGHGEAEVKVNGESECSSKHNTAQGIRVYDRVPRSIVQIDLRLMYNSLVAGESLSGEFDGQPVLCRERAIH